MKSLFFLFLLFSFFSAKAQIIIGTVKDNISEEALIYANLSFLKVNQGVSTQENGEFKLDISKHKNDTLLISYIGYHSKKIAVSSLLNNDASEEILLQKNQEAIDEVILSVKKARYTSVKKLGFSRKGAFTSSQPYGSETVSWIKNERRTLGKLKQLKIYFKKMESEIYETHTAYILVKFYKAYAFGAPGELIQYQPIILKPENKTYPIRINLEEANILFPKEGVFVGFEVIQPSYENPKSSMYVMSPSLAFVHTKETRIFYRFRGKTWHKTRRTSPFKKGYYKIPFVKIWVKYRK